MKLIDLSVMIESGLPSDPPFMIPEIEYWDHERGADNMVTFFPGSTKADLPQGLGWSIEFLKLTTHSGTHLDAPWHYHPTAGGEAAKVRLCKLTLRKSNLLVLDEPTNHLDVEAKKELRRALREYKGTLLMVSHEPEFYEDWIDAIWNIERWTTKIV